MNHDNTERPSPNELMDERIDAFLKGKLNAEQETALRNEIKTDATLRQRCRERILLIQGIQQAGQQRDQSILDKTQERSPKTRNSRLALRLAIPLSVAAVLALVFVFNKGGQNPAVAADSGLALDYALQHSASFSMHQTYSRGGGSEEDELDALFQDCWHAEGQQLSEARQSLEQHFLLTLDDLQNDIADDYPAETAWFLTLAYLRSGNTQKAIKVLSDCLERAEEISPQTEEQMRQLLELLKKE